ncbi:unnamed protein product [Mytilus edulis]|uniref:Apple domain-containing protein n=1 Tax=Mytilus edulis TaxID=6550 RepID=A0A8S3TXP4_MYTED|nr:unnamed protein product [Mytilus edulis]
MSANVDGFITERDKGISINNQATIVGSKLACSALCLKETDCCFANYRDKTKECILGTLDKCHAATQTAIGWLLLRKGKAYNNKVFFSIADALPWLDAQAYCNTFGMRLATISSANENDFEICHFSYDCNMVRRIRFCDKKDWKWDKPSRK